MDQHETGIDFQAFFDRAPGLLCVIGRDGRLAAASAALRELLGLPEGELRGASLVDRLHPDDRDALLAALRAPADRAAVQLEVRARAEDGTMRRLEWSLSARPGHALLFAVGHDITERDTLARRFKALLDAAPQFIGISDLEAKIIYSNPGSMTLVGRPGYDETRISDYHPPELAPFYQQEVIPTVIREGVWSGETEFVHHGDGARIPMSQVIVLMRDADGQPESFGTIAHDLRPQKRLEEALKESIHELSTPIIQVWDGVLALPLIGLIDSRRAAQMTESLLDAIVRHSCRVAILDMTGVRTVDTSTLDHLFKMISAASLLGSRCLVSGVSPEVAQTVTQLNLDLSSVRTFHSLREALGFALGERARPSKRAPAG